MPSGLGKAGVSPASGLLRLAETARRRSPLAGDPAVDGSRAAVSTVLPVTKPVNLFDRSGAPAPSSVLRDGEAHWNYDDESRNRAETGTDPEVSPDY